MDAATFSVESLEQTNPQRIGGPHGVYKPVCGRDVDRTLSWDHVVGPLLILSTPNGLTFVVKCTRGDLVVKRPGVLSTAIRLDLALGVGRVLSPSCKEHHGEKGTLSLSSVLKFGGPYPQYGWDFPEEIPEEFRKDPGNGLRAFPGIPLTSPKPYN